LEYSNGIADIEGKMKKGNKKRPMIKVPEKCLCCGAGYAGGCQLPGEEFPLTGLRVFYKCGASMSIKEAHDYGYLILFKNCGKEAADEQAKDS
jgi:hypothetical protein